MIPKPPFFINITIEFIDKSTTTHPLPSTAIFDNIPSLSMAHLRYSICRCDSCSSSSLGYRAFTKDGLKKHKKSSPDMPHPALYSSNFDHANTFARLQSIEEELKWHESNPPPISTLVFHPLTFDQPSSKPLAAALVTTSKENEPIIKFDRWYQSNSLYLRDLSITDAQIAMKRDMLIQRMSSYHQELASRVSVIRKNPETAIDRNVSAPKSIGRLIDQEISLVISSYDYPTPLAFQCECMDYDSHKMQCKLMAGYARLGLDPNQAHSRLSINQLQWIDAISDQLQSPIIKAALELERVEEIISGLKEHRRNVLAHIEAERFKCINPNMTVHAIITRKLPVIIQKSKLNL
jgi:hypothetical protein